MNFYRLLLLGNSTSFNSSFQPDWNKFDSSNGKREKEVGWNFFTHKSWNVRLFCFQQVGTLEPGTCVGWRGWIVSRALLIHVICCLENMKSILRLNHFGICGNFSMSISSIFTNITRNWIIENTAQICVVPNCCRCCIVISILHHIRVLTLIVTCNVISHDYRLGVERKSPPSWVWSM